MTVQLLGTWRLGMNRTVCVPCFIRFPTPFANQPNLFADNVVHMLGHWSGTIPRANCA